jgi:tRNA A-37 threonylcarbamoyl transferase component Bud32
MIQMKINCSNKKCENFPKEKNTKNSNSFSINSLFNCPSSLCKKNFCSSTCYYKHFRKTHNFPIKNFDEKFQIDKNLKNLVEKSKQNYTKGKIINENLYEYKFRNKISDKLKEKQSNINIKYIDIEDDYKNLDYFEYFDLKNFINTDGSNILSSNLKNDNNIKNKDKDKGIDYKNINVNINNISNPKIELKKNIGSGAFGEIYLITNKFDGKTFALKKVNKDKIKENGLDFSIIIREINTNFKFVHKNITRLYDYFEDKYAFYLLMEFVENGNLFNEIQKTNGINEEKAIKYFVDISSAVFFLHENNFIHRDIKPENCLIDENDNVKLCDFGWTVEISPGSSGERMTFCGTYEYMAPEIVKEIPYNHMIDIWSLGILLYELLHSFSPFRVIIIQY